MIGLAVFGIVFVIGFLLFRPRRNPYIETHKKKWRNEKDYDEYIKWLDKNGGDIPIPEVKFKEDIEAIKEVTKNFK